MILFSLITFLLDVILSEFYSIYTRVNEFCIPLRINMMELRKK